MRITKPVYYDRFRCVAGDCPDSCCKEWGVQVDAASAARYRALEGPLGDRLRQVLQDEDGSVYMAIENRRCPMWRNDGLCRIQAELGEEALCKTCREFPRLRHDYGDFAEFQLELSCPVAARLILTAAPSAPVMEELPGGAEPEYDPLDMAILKATRERMLAILSDLSRPIPETLALGLMYGYQAQGELDGGDSMPFDSDAAMEEAQSFAKPGDSNAMTNFFLELELLTPEWEEMLRSPVPGGWSAEYLPLARYFVERYWLQAISDFDLAGRVKFLIIACLMIHQVGGDIFRTAQLFSKEIENDADNVDTILDAAYSHPAFTDDKLLGLLLGRA